MPLLRSVFGPSKKEIWSNVAKDIGGEFKDGGFWGKDGLRYSSGQWELLLDTYTISNGKTTTTYTRLRTPFINKDGLYFKIYRSGIFSRMGSFLGMQDIQIGDHLFDQDFIIKGNNEEKIRLLFSDERLKSLIKQQPRISVVVKDDEGFFSKSYPNGVDLLQFQCLGVIKDAQVIKDLFDLFSCILERLVQLDSAYEDDPGIKL
ncbi:MAG: DUF3137 domain-containing protein [Spirulina sp. SIO3F2]|nr:DUF3137 domain-containing protein [Spirulina sp. SIO3F2]